MYRAIKLNKYRFSDIQITECVISFTERKFAMHCKFYSETQEICNTLQISRKSFVYLQRISFLAIKIECKMNSKVNK
jgi:hypothetical protein